MKKIISILTVCLMLLSFVPAVFSYAEATPTYTISNHKYQDGNQYWCVPGQPATITASDGFTISRTADGEFKEALIQTAYQDPPASVFLKSIETGEVTEVQFTDQINWDQNAPGAAVTVGGTYSSSAFTEINMGDCDTYFMEPVTIDIATSDTNGSGVASVQYIVRDYPLNLEDLETLEESEWQTCDENKLVINSIGTYIVYFKITDNVGNVKYVNSCLFAYGGALRIENDNPYYIAPDGTTKAEVKFEDISWLKEQAGGMTAWFGLDNSSGKFEDASVFHVEWLDKDTSEDKWNGLFNQLDMNHRESIEGDKMYMFDIGVTDPEGRELTNSSAPVYVEIPADWDTDDLKAAYIAPGADEAVSVSIAEEDVVPANGGQFVKLSLNHFSPYVIYDSLSDEEKAAAGNQSAPADKDTDDKKASEPKTGDTSHSALWFIILCAAFTTCVSVKRKA